jgi:hypothetical protein
MVNRVHDEFFTRAGFTAYQHCRIRRSHLADQLEYMLHGRAVSDHAAGSGVSLRVRRRLARFHFTRQFTLFDRAFYLREHQSEIERHRNVVEGTQLHGIDGGSAIALRSHNDERTIGPALPSAAKHFQAIQSWHADVEECGIRLL